MENNVLNPLDSSGTPLVPLVLTQYQRYVYAQQRRDAHAWLVCSDMLAGRDHSWDLARFAVLEAFCKAHLDSLR